MISADNIDVFYLALILIFLGLISLLFVLLSAWSKDATNLPPAESRNRQETNESARTTENASIDEYASSQEHNVYYEQDVYNPEQQKPTEPIDQQRYQQQNRSFAAEPSVDRNPYSDVNISSNRKAPPLQQKPTESLHIPGVLYLDMGRRLLEWIDQGAECPPAIFSDLKRIGQGRLIMDESGIRIYSGSAAYTFGPDDLREIAFMQKGLALIPEKKDRPLIVYLTDEPEEIKNFIKKHRAGTH